ncbi:unnamed protein product [Ixodes pacificus]
MPGFCSANFAPHVPGFDVLAYLTTIPVLIRQLLMFKTLFLMSPVLYSALLFFLKHLEYRAAKLICDNTNSVSRERFFALNYYNKVSCYEKLCRPRRLHYKGVLLYTVVGLS